MLKQWRYQQFATRILYSLLQRDIAPTPKLAQFFLEQCISPHTATRAIAVRCVRLRMSAELTLNGGIQWYHQDIGPDKDENVLRQHGGAVVR